MIVENTTILEEIVKTIVDDLNNRNIESFGEWLLHYDEIFDEVVQIIDEYCEKVQENRIDEIEHWQQVIMLNSMALYMIEMDTKHVPVLMMNQILAAFVKGIKRYALQKQLGIKNLEKVFIYNSVQ